MQQKSPLDDMGEKNTSTLVGNLLSAAHVFSTTVNMALDEELMRNASNGQLTPAQMKLLKLVSWSEALTVGDAAAFLGVSKAAASKAVDKLVRKMFLQRSTGQTDRREICISLTDESRRVLARYENAREQKLREIFSMSAPGELEKIAGLLDCLSARIAIENSNAQPGKPCFQCGTYFRENCVLRTQLGRDCFHRRKTKAATD